jgi:hypothetical protein
MRFSTAGTLFAFILATWIGTAAAAGAQTAAPGAEYVGPVRGLDNGAVAISTDGANVLAYVCDGTPTKIAVAQWFKGTLSHDSLSLAAGEAKLTAHLKGDRAGGTVTLANGRKFDFRAIAVADSSGDAGFFRSLLDAGGHQYIGGWIELPQSGELSDSQSQYLTGWVEQTGTGQAGGIIDELHAVQVAPALQPATTRVLSNVGLLDVHRVRAARMQ